MAEEARSVVVLQVTVLFLDGGAPRSSGVDPLPTASPWLCGAVRLVFPFAGGRGTADLAQEHSADAEAQRRDDDGVFRRRSFEIGARRLPACSGGLRIQGVKRSLSSGAPPTALVVSGVVELHKDGASAWLRMRHGDLALEDARKGRMLRPRWSKAWYREGTALSFMKDYEGAADALREALQLDPKSAEIKEALRRAEKAVEEPQRV